MSRIALHKMTLDSARRRGGEQIGTRDTEHDGGRRQVTLLVVEDNLATRKLIVYWLAKHYEVFAARPYGGGAAPGARPRGRWPDPRHQLVRGTYRRGTTPRHSGSSPLPAGRPQGGRLALDFLNGNHIEAADDLSDGRQRS